MIHTIKEKYLTSYNGQKAKCHLYIDDYMGNLDFTVGDALIFRLTTLGQLVFPSGNKMIPALKEDWLKFNFSLATLEELNNGSILVKAPDNKIIARVTPDGYVFLAWDPDEWSQYTYINDRIKFEG